jgi:hypothetical protein
LKKQYKVDFAVVRVRTARGGCQWRYAAPEG